MNLQPPLRIFLGHDPRETLACAVAEASLLAHATCAVDVRHLSLRTLGPRYTRPTDSREGRLWDVISDAPMSTQHANARFFVPELMAFKGWALFADGDILLRDDIAKLFALADDRFAVMTVQHPEYTPGESRKMDNQLQTAYSRKNWSSVVLWNCGHPAHRTLYNDDMANVWPGRNLHAFCWLTETEIGALPPTWNYLVGVNKLTPAHVQLAHFTLGTPDMLGYESQLFAREWRATACKLGQHEWLDIVAPRPLSGLPSSVEPRRHCRHCRLPWPSMRVA